LPGACTLERVLANYDQLRKGDLEIEKELPLLGEVKSPASTAQQVRGR